MKTAASKKDAAVFSGFLFDLATLAGDHVDVATAKTDVFKFVRGQLGQNVDRTARVVPCNDVCNEVSDSSVGPVSKGSRASESASLVKKCHLGDPYMNGLLPGVC